METEPCARLYDLSICPVCDGFFLEREFVSYSPHITSSFHRNLNLTMSTSLLTWLTASLATISAVNARPAEHEAANKYSAPVKANAYSSAASSFATAKADPASITSALSLSTKTAFAGEAYVTATIDGAVVSWVNDYPAASSAIRNSAGDVIVSATIDGQVVSWANNWTPSPSTVNAAATSSQGTSATSSTSSTPAAASSPSVSSTSFPPPTISGGLSTLGTLEQAYYPKYLPGSTSYANSASANYSTTSSDPWKTRLVSLDAYTHSNVPTTNVTRYYNLTISQGTTNADGVYRDTITINGQFPGPVIEANWGDYIEVAVTNNISFEGTSVHWHGLRQSQTPWMDGVPSLSQCPIAPGATFSTLR